MFGIDTFLGALKRTFRPKNGIRGVQPKREVAKTAVQPPGTPEVLIVNGDLMPEWAKPTNSPRERMALVMGQKPVEKPEPLSRHNARLIHGNRRRAEFVGRSGQVLRADVVERGDGQVLLRRCGHRRAAAFNRVLVTG